ncbi:hypothetical protein ABE28_013420 [Peribacillus muralis]|uniref:Uncharacterized protein n=1 Tax=Peribacillus muralis TaxID=264697 RepID=A0A1B3XQ75_9BACI|nr:hypothetical protein ABE28_013420 [Peribacillus muralis]
MHILYKWRLPFSCARKQHGRFYHGVQQANKINKWTLLYAKHMWIQRKLKRGLEYYIPNPFCLQTEETLSGLLPFKII